MGSVPLAHYLALGSGLFAVGFAALLVRRNALVVFMGVELMLNAANMTFLAFSRAHQTMSGQAAAFSERESCFVYEDLALPVSFTGGLLLGADFIEEMYVHMGFHPAYKYRRVVELSFAEGRLAEARDVSEAMARFREDIEGRPMQPGAGASFDEIEAWIRQTFRQDYTL